MSKFFWCRILLAHLYGQWPTLTIMMLISSDMQSLQDVVTHLWSALQRRWDSYVLLQGTFTAQRHLILGQRSRAQGSLCQRRGGYCLCSPLLSVFSLCLEFGNCGRNVCVLQPFTVGNCTWQVRLFPKQLNKGSCKMTEALVSQKAGG